MKFAALLIATLARAAAGQTCVPAGSLPATGSLQGTLSEANCRLSDGSYYAAYSLTAPAQGRISLQGDSSGFDLNLILRDALGNRLASGTSLTLPVEFGPLTVIVTSAASGQTGSFSLRSEFMQEPGTLCRAFPRIGAGQAATGSPGARSCRLPDQSPFDAYTFAPFGPGTLDVTLESTDFAGLVMLRGNDGFLLASDAAGISAPVDGDTGYTILVTSAGGKTGNYRLTTAFTPAEAEGCRSLKTITGPDSRRDSISSRSCRMTFGSTGSILPFNYYDLKLTEPGEVEIRFAASAFDPILSLLDANGNPLESDLAGGGPGLAVLRQDLPPATYTILALSADPDGGDYSLDVIFRPGLPQTCPLLALDAGNTVSGSVNATSSCRSTKGMADFYRIVLPSAGKVDLAMASGDFDPYLELKDARGNRLAENDYAGNAPTSNVTANLPAGTFVVAAGSLAAPGGYTFQYRFTPGDVKPCAKVQPIEVNSAAVGGLGFTGCTGDNGQPVDYFEFTAPAGGTVAALMSSTQIDSWLTVEDTQGNVLRRDDNTFGAGNALLVQFLPEQTYRLGARSSLAGVSGPYRLDLLFSPGDRPAGCAPLRSVGVGDSVEGTLNYTSCAYPDYTFADIYQVTVADTTPLDIQLNSDRFDAHLLLLDAKGNVVEEDDDSGDETNARITATVNAGTYFVVAKPTFDLTSLGPYTLVVNQAAN